MAKVSVIIPCYNHGQYIMDAITSVEAYPDKNDYEIIIINDGSTDQFTNDLLSDLKIKGYNVIFQINQGLGNSRNNGIKIAKGDYILPLDADNRISVEYIRKSIGILDNNPNISVVYGDAEYFGEKTGLWKVGEFDPYKLKTGNYIDACAVYRKSVWEQVGGYDTNMPYQGVEDWDFWLSLLENNFTFYYIPDVLFYYRVLSNSMINSIISDINKQKVLLSKIFYKHINLYDDYLDAFSAKHRIDYLQDRIDYLQDRIEKMHQSTSYRLGSVLLKPFRIIKKIFLKKSNG